MQLHIARWPTVAMVVAAAVAVVLAVGADPRPVDRWDVATGIVLVVAGAAVFAQARHRSDGALLMVAGVVWFAGNLSSLDGPVGDVAERLTFVHRGVLVHAALIPLVARRGGPADRATRWSVTVLIVGCYAASWSRSIAGSAGAVTVLGCLVALVIVRRRPRWPGAVVALSVLGWSACAGVLQDPGWLSNEQRLRGYQLAIAATAVAIGADRLARRRPRTTVEIADLERRGLLIAFDHDGTFRTTAGRVLDPAISPGATVIDLGEGRGRVLVAGHDPAWGLLAGEPDFLAAVSVLADHHRLVERTRRHTQLLTAAGRRLVVAEATSVADFANDLHREVVEPLAALEAAARHLHDPTVADATTARLHSIRQELAGLSSGLIASPASLPSALGELASRFRRLGDGLGVTVVTEIGDHPADLDPVATRTLALVANEAVVNAAKHAQARRVTLRLEHDGTAVVLTVSDDGRGGATVIADGGLEGIQDRLRTLGGHLTVTSRPGSGTTVVARLPIAVAVGLSRP